MRITNDTAVVVTGGASGLGAATARALAARGAKVGIFDVDESAGRAISADIGAVFARVDVTSDEQVAAGFRAVRSNNGQERVLVNCAGVSEGAKTARRDRKTGEVVSCPISKFQRAIEINLIGTFRCIAQSVAGMMTTQPLEHGERGAIVNTASIAAEDGQVGQAAYAASKAGIIGMTLPIARDLMSEGIRVNTILPGLFDTPLMRSMAQDIQDGLANAVAFPKRFGDPMEYADLVLFMIESGYFNGASARLDGGLRMPPR
jgi:NAD(P)-dependent dehydrogenase (short-subunit alcohol dehydrogenase family)